ncbi:MAG: L,D-transpeptidase [Gemmatimonadetes bacterium]|nr:L,D-transpeptidase [Gemmatimonadota bacterium]
MANPTRPVPARGPAPPAAPRLTRDGRPASWHASRGLPLALGLLALALSAGRLAAQASAPADRRIVVSLDAKRLWLLEGSDTLFVARIAAGRESSFNYRGKTLRWRTPAGERTVLARRRDPVWTVPDWHYYERAANEGLKLVEMVRDMQYRLADGSRLAVRDRDVVRILGDQYWTVPVGHELIVDGVLYAPPAGTRQRYVPGALGTRALDLGEGILIHGTSPFNRMSIGAAASHGCIRMETADIERLYDLVSEGTRVWIY